MLVAACFASNPWATSRPVEGSAIITTRVSAFIQNRPSQPSEVPSWMGEVDGREACAILVRMIAMAPAAISARPAVTMPKVRQRAPTARSSRRPCRSVHSGPTPIR